MRDYTGDLKDFSIASGGIKALAIYFHGNDVLQGTADPLYCAFEDADGNDAVAYIADNSDLDQGEWSMLWHEFNIDLADFTAAGVDLTRIQKVYIGVGDYFAGTGTATNTGNVYLDDMGFHPSRCVYAEGPAADFYFQRDGLDYYDCTVGYEDLRVMGNSWLHSAPGTVTKAGGFTGPPVAMWKFDETDGEYAQDSAAYPNDVNDYKLRASDLATTHWVNDGDINSIHPDPISGDVIEFDGAFRMSIMPPSSQMAALWGYFTDEITISMWAKGIDYDGTVEEWPASGCMFGANRVADAYARMLNVTFPQKYQLEVGNFLWRAGDQNLWTSSPDDYDDCRWNDNTKSSNFQGEWNHLAVTKNISTGIMVNYLNGEIVEMEGGRHIPFNPMLAQQLPGEVATFGVGADSETLSNPYYGLMCDVRLYNYALTHAEILRLCDVASVSQGLMLQGDTDDDDDVDLGDYAILANTFLDVQLWP
jgi:hypothetical protein